MANPEGHGEVTFMIGPTHSLDEPGCLTLVDQLERWIPSGYSASPSANLQKPAGCKGVQISSLRRQMAKRKQAMKQPQNALPPSSCSALNPVQRELVQTFLDNYKARLAATQKPLGERHAEVRALGRALMERAKRYGLDHLKAHGKSASQTSRGGKELSKLLRAAGSKGGLLNHGAAEFVPMADLWNKLQEKKQRLEQAQQKLSSAEAPVDGGRRFREAQLHVLDAFREEVNLCAKEYAEAEAAFYGSLPPNLTSSSPASRSLRSQVLDRTHSTFAADDDGTLAAEEIESLASPEDEAFARSATFSMSSPAVATSAALDELVGGMDQAIGHIRVRLKMRIWLKSARYSLKERSLIALLKDVQLKQCRAPFKSWLNETRARRHYRRHLLQLGMDMFKDQLNEQFLLVHNVRSSGRSSLFEVFLKRKVLLMWHHWALTKRASERRDPAPHFHSAIFLWPWLQESWSHATRVKMEIGNHQFVQWRLRKILWAWRGFRQYEDLKRLQKAEAEEYRKRSLIHHAFARWMHLHKHDISQNHHRKWWMSYAFKSL
eukprot:RCo050324